MTESRISYNVSLNVAEEREEEWLEWMKNEHLPEVMATGLFLEARFFVMSAMQEGMVKTYVVQYLLAQQEDMETYKKKHAVVLRSKTLQRFGESVLAFRTEMSLLQEIKK